MIGYNPLVETRDYKMSHASGICIGVEKQIGNRTVVPSPQSDVNLSPTLKASQTSAPGKAASGGCNPGGQAARIHNLRHGMWKKQPAASEVVSPKP